MHTDNFKPKLFAFDVDGTIIKNNGDFGIYTKDVLSSLGSLGHYPILISARPIKSLLNISTMLWGSGKIIVAFNGAVIVENDIIIMESPIRSVDLKKILYYGEKSDCQLNVYCGEDWYVKSMGSLIEKEAEIVGFKPQIVSSFDDILLRKVHKILVLGDPIKIKRLFEALSFENIQINASFSKINYGEIVSSEVSKAGSLRSIAKYLKISINDTIAFGDAENDIDMISEAGIGIAVGNALQKVKDVADFTTESNENDGVGKALKLLGFVI